MDKIRFWIRRYFGFSRSETNGFFLLLLLVILAGAAPLVFYSAAPPIDSRQDQARLDSLVVELEALARKEPRRQLTTAALLRIPLKKFDPNALTRQEWVAMGISAFAAGNILKYKEKAGGFRYKEQLSRIYGLPPELYQQLAPFIDLPSRSSARKGSRPLPNRKFSAFPSRSFPKPSRLQAFDINVADTTQLKKIKGIGSKLSARIIRFRDKLGGFLLEEQLSEVYGLSPEVVDSLQRYVFVREGFTPQQLPVNTASLQELQAHPYLGYRTGRLIVAYRTQHGPFQSLEDLLKIHQINETQYRRMLPYLRL